MKTNRNNKKNKDVVYYDACVAVTKNGDVAIVPEPYVVENGPVTPDGGTLLSRGRMKMTPDGTAVYVPFHHSNEPLYEVPVYTEHGKVKCYPSGTVLVQFKFNPEMSNKEIAKALYLEAVEINQMIK